MDVLSYRYDQEDRPAVAPAGRMELKRLVIPPAQSGSIPEQADAPNQEKVRPADTTPRELTQPGQPHHSAWQPGQAQIAAEGSADRRSARRRGRAVESIARSAPLGLSAPLPRGGPMSHAVAGPWPATPGSRGLHAAQRCASCTSRRSGASVRAAISWTEPRSLPVAVCGDHDACARRGPVLRPHS
jgi:hypothetical protein